MGAPITLSIILPCGEAVEHLHACLDQFRDWRPAPELICVVPQDQPQFADALASHPAEPYVVTATGSRAALLAAGVAEAQGSVLLLLDPATRLGSDTHRTIFRTLAKAEQGAGFFRIAARETPTGKALADPVAVTFSSLMHAPLGPGALFVRAQALQAAGGVPSHDTLFDYRLAKKLGQQTTVVALHEQVESLRDGHMDAWHLIGLVIRLSTGAPLSSLTPEASPAALPVVASTPAPPKSITIVEPPTMMILSPVMLADSKPVELDPGEFTVQIESHPEPDREAAPVVAIATDPAPPIASPDTPLVYADATPIITAGQAGFDALFLEESQVTAQSPEPATVWEKMNAAFHRMLFHDAAGPNTPVPGTLPSIDLARIRAAEASAQSDPKPDPSPAGNGKHAEVKSQTEASPAPEITFDWTPHPTGGLRGDPRIPWSRAPVDPADADPFTAAELSQVRRAFTDLLHPAPAEPASRPAGRIIELAITPPELKERRERQEGE